MALILVVSLACAAAGYLIGQRKGRALQGCLLGLVLGLVGLVILAFLRPRQPGGAPPWGAYGPPAGTLGEYPPYPPLPPPPGPYPGPGTPAGWLPDPSGRYELRWWDGVSFTPQVSTQGVREVDHVPFG